MFLRPRLAWTHVIPSSAPQVSYPHTTQPMCSEHKHRLHCQTVGNGHTLLAHSQERGGLAAETHRTPAAVCRNSHQCEGDRDTLKGGTGAKCWAHLPVHGSLHRKSFFTRHSPLRALKCAEETQGDNSLSITLKRQDILFPLPGID